MSSISARHRKTLAAIFSDPVSGTIKWRDVEAMLVALGAEISEGSGSRIRFTLNRRMVLVHRPHPSPNTKRHTVRSIGEFLLEAGVHP
jgi:hypothetical protein